MLDLKLKVAKISVSTNDSLGTVKELQVMSQELITLPSLAHGNRDESAAPYENFYSIKALSKRN
ncbi:hypothetical protein [Cellulosilyticum sp. WCF-2]|uniref:hypothetical protein n=1 Tax=Cellulosilyticum sp. WCF-2 TaxID=2497860 RepID=UPI000F8CA870|nr:hypothetical protein [Cellulosilyticum sp. WCF-2]QEH69706.1 hypothetical protein EKH84_15420 [Cellulosilyticum sp. WCF-2]